MRLTPRERAIETRTDLELNETLPFSDRFRLALQDAIEQAITADRSQLQSEIVSELRSRQGVLPTMSKESLELDRAITAIQSIFSQSPPAESKPEERDMTVEEFTRAILETKSNRLVLAEREACLEIAEKWHQVSIDEDERCDYVEQVIKEIRSRSNPAPQSQPEEKQCRKDVYGQYDKYPCALPVDHAGQCKYQGELWAESQKEAAEQNAKIKTVPIVAHENLQSLSHHFEKVNEWQAEKIIKLQEENHALQEKSEHFKKCSETPWLYHETTCQCGYCLFARMSIEGSTNRKT